MSRRNAREDAFRIIFESLINKLEANEYLENYFEAVKEDFDGEECAFLNKPFGSDAEYIVNTLNGVLEKQAELDQIISENLVGWSVERISKVSVAAMRLALFEIIYAEDIPVKVAVNEAVEIAKKYDGPECASFVNGALGSAIKKMNISDSE